MKILSIDAWADCEPKTWTWNNWFKIGDIDKEVFESLDTNRKLLKYMREEGYLSETSKGLISVDNDQYNIVFCERSNNMPLFAIEYGPEY